MSEELEPPATDVAPQPFVGRPRSVLWTGIICLSFGLLSLGLQSMFLMGIGAFGLTSWLQAGLWVVAGSLVFALPRSRTAFYAGALALAVLVYRSFAGVVYSLQDYRMNLLDRAIAACIGVAFALLVTWLGWKFIKGKPSREYFRLPV
jgi:hypothetical protein